MGNFKEALQRRADFVMDALGDTLEMTTVDGTTARKAKRHDVDKTVTPMMKFGKPAGREQPALYVLNGGKQGEARNVMMDIQHEFQRWQFGDDRLIMGHMTQAAIEFLSRALGAYGMYPTFDELWEIIARSSRGDQLQLVVNQMGAGDLACYMLREVHEAWAIRSTGWFLQPTQYEASVRFLPFEMLGRNIVLEYFQIFSTLMERLGIGLSDFEQAYEEMVQEFLGYYRIDSRERIQFAVRLCALAYRPYDLAMARSMSYRPNVQYVAWLAASMNPWLPQMAAVKKEIILDSLLSRWK